MVRDYLDNSKGERMFTEGLIVDSLRSHYPKHHLSVTPAYSTNLLAFAQSNEEVCVFPISTLTSILFYRKTRLTGASLIYCVTLYKTFKPEDLRSY